MEQNVAVMQIYLHVMGAASFLMAVAAAYATGIWPPKNMA